MNRTSDPAVDAARPARDLFSWIPLALAIPVVGAAFAGGGFFVVARYGAMAVLALQVFIEVRQGRNRFMTSPLFLLSALTATFFSFVQGIWGEIAPGFSWADFPAYVGSSTEAIILSFAMTGFVFYNISSRYWREPGKTESECLEHGGNLLPGLILVFVLIIALLNSVLFHLNSSGDVAPALAAQVRFCTPALMSISLFFLARAVQGRGRKFLAVVLATALFAVLTLVYVREGKIVIFLVCALALYFARLHGLDFRRLLLAAVATLVVGLIMIQVVQMVRQPHLSAAAPMVLEPTPAGVEAPGMMAWITKVAVGKAVWRQTETGYCFGNVLKDHAGAPFDLSKQNFWLIGLVPRVLWPAKPSLSLGQHYDARYCFKPVEKVGRHSASITLLGQPVIMGGWIGLVVHGGLLLLALAAMEGLNRDPRALPGVLVGALLPYLIDFDQDFALYVANAVKFALVMGVLYVPIAVIEKRRSPAP